MAEGIRSLIGKKMSKTVKFVGEDIKIVKLSVSDVMEIQERAKAVTDDATAGYDLLKRIIKMSAEGADDLADEDFESFPMDELSKLSNEIMKFSGLSGNEAGK